MSSTQTVDLGDSILSKLTQNPKVASNQSPSRHQSGSSHGKDGAQVDQAKRAGKPRQRGPKKFKQSERPQAQLGQESSKTKTQPSDEDDEEALLLQEIKKLGGGPDDLNLVDVSDEAEVLEGGKLEDPTLERDLKKLLKELNSSAADHALPKSSGTHLTGRDRMSALAHSPNVATTALYAKCEDPVEKARLEKQEAKVKQRRLEAQKRDERLHKEKEESVKEEVLTRKSTTCEKVARVEKDLKSGLSNPEQIWLIQPQPLWYEVGYLPSLPASGSHSAAPLSETTVELLLTRAEHVVNCIGEQFSRSLQPAKVSGLSKKATFGGLSESDKAFIHKILTCGTGGDKLSALTLIVSAAPLQSMPHLTTLLSLCKKKNREEAGKAIRAVVNWLRGGGDGDAGGLPPRKLKYFRDQPGLATVAELQGLIKGKSKTKTEPHGRMEGDEWLALWAFEDWLKRWYLELLQVVEGFSHDPLVFIRTQGISHLFYLLTGKPEQEQNLLTLLVNKLGDGDKSVCSRTSHYLLQLLQIHPLMKGIVIREISALVLKPTVPHHKTAVKSKKASDPSSLKHHDHARYYGIITLNQMVFVREDIEICNKLIDLYFELFSGILGSAASEEEEADKKEEADNMNEAELEAQSTKQKGAAAAQKKSRRKAPPHKLSQGDEVEQFLEEKTSRLIAAILTGLNRAFPYGSLSDDVFQAHMSTLFRIIHTGTFNVSIQALIFVQHVAVSRPSIVDRFFRVLYATLFDPRLFAATSKHALYLNMLFKSLESDQNVARVLAFVKRITQVLPYHQPPFICSTLVLLGELFHTTKENVAQLLGPPQSSKHSHENNCQYDGRKRDPSFANALHSSLWELVPLLSHFHPAVSLNARQLLTRQPVTSAVNLEHNTLSSFLDKFVYRQPKKNIAPKGSSIMQPDMHARLGGVMKNSKGKSTVCRVQNLPMNSAALLNRPDKDIPVDEVFFHKYFLAKNRKDKEQGKKSKKMSTEIPDIGGERGEDDGQQQKDEVYDSDDDDDEVRLVREQAKQQQEEEEQEEQVWKAMQASMSRELQEELDDEDGESWEDDSAIDPEKELASDENSTRDGCEDVSNGFASDDQIILDTAGTIGSASGTDDDSLEAGEAQNSGAFKRKKSHLQPGSKKHKRKKPSDLPVFAAAEDYADILSKADK